MTADERAASWRLALSATLFGVMAVMAKTASRAVPGPEAAAVRFATGVAVVGALWVTGRIALRPKRWGWLFARGLFGGTAVLAYFAAIQRIPVGEATLLNYTQPVFTMLFAWLLLGERPLPRALVALPVTLVGVSLIVGIRVTDLHGSVGELLGLASAVLSGVAVTAIRAARRHAPDGTPGESAWTVFTAFTVLGLVASAPTVLPPFGHWVAPTARVWILMLAVGATSVVAQLILTEALKHVRVDTAGIVSQLAAAVAIGGGALLLGETPSPGFLGGAAITLAGVALVVLGGNPPFGGKRRVWRPRDTRSP